MVRPSPGRALPRVLALVIIPGNKVVILGELSPAQVRRLLQELATAQIARGGSETRRVVLPALFALVAGSTVLGLSAARRRRAE